MGKNILQPRKVAYMADSPSLGYTYSGVQGAPEAGGRSSRPRSASRAAGADGRLVSLRARWAPEVAGWGGRRPQCPLTFLPPGAVQAEPWHPSVAQIRARVEELAGCKFNSCLLNLYRDGARLPRSLEGPARKAGAAAG